MFIAVSFRAAKPRKQQRCPSIGEWISTLLFTSVKWDFIQLDKEMSYQAVKR